MELQTQSNYIAEQTVLGIILLEPDLIKECTLTDEAFFAPENKIIFRNMLEVEKSESPLDVGSLMVKLYDTGEMKVITELKGYSYLNDLAASVPTTQNFNFFCKLLIEAQQVRQAQRYAREIMSLTGSEGDIDTINENLNKIQNVLETGVKERRDIRDILISVYDRIESGAEPGIKTGFDDYDRLTLGLHKTDLTIIAARPSIGKTAFALNIASNVASEKDEEWNLKNHVHIFSLEMIDEQLVQRMLAAEGRINAHNLRSGQLTDDDWRKMTLSMGLLNNLNDCLTIHDDAIMTTPEIRKRVRAAQREFPDLNHVIIIDYLQLLTYHGKSNDNNTVKVGEISKDLKRIAKELNVPVIALSQLSRGVEQRQDKRPIMSDIRESGNIEQDADNIVFLYREDYYDKETENQNIIELIIAKQRNGAVGTVQMAFIKEYGLFVNLERRYNSA